jgi:hypothetical protein
VGYEPTIFCSKCEDAAQKLKENFHVFSFHPIIVTLDSNLYQRQNVYGFFAAGMEAEKS